MPFLSLGLNDSQTANDDAQQDSAARMQDTSTADRNDSSDRNVRATQSLPPEIESLREKLSRKSAVKPVIKPLASSVSALSSSERYGVPTFSTFKFGYVPARGLLYSSIGHELALLGLFIIFTYGMPAFKGQKLVAP